MTTTATRLPNGTMARITRDITSLTSDREYPAGTRFIVNDYVSSEDAADDVPFYWGNINDGLNNITVLAADVELAMTAEQVNGRSIPTRRAVLDALMMSHIEGDGFDLQAADGDFETGTIEYSGRTTEGLPFGFTIQLTSLSEIDA
jgi:hypothetical protein